MIFVHIEKDNEMHVHRREDFKTVETVVSDVVSEFGAPLSIDNGDMSVRVLYDDWCAYVTEI